MTTSKQTKFLTSFASIVLGTFVASCSQFSTQSDLNTAYTQENNQITTLSGKRQISGIYPHLTVYTHARTDGIIGKGQEAGIGALAEWQDKLYMITYAAHEPKGSEHKLYIIDKNKNVEVFQQSVGGTPAGRIIHQESDQLFIGPYVIDKQGSIRVISPKDMPGRLTGIARHIKDPENKVYYYDMEGMLYEVDVHTLEVSKLFHDPLPGWHGKGAYTAQDKLVLTNNGESGHFSKQKAWQVPAEGMVGKEKYGVLAEFDGEKFKVVERKQYTDVTTKHGVKAVPNDQSPLWSMGWDKKSVRLSVMEEGKWNTFLLPKATFNNDPSHGWFTEWPRIRSIGDEMLMDMHGMFYELPSEFSTSNSKGLRPWGSHLRYIPDFLEWNGDIVLATDEASVQGNPLTGQAQSNLWFGSKNDLKNWGPANGYGAIWLDEKVEANSTSLPYLNAGFDNRTVHLVNHGKRSTLVHVEMDRKGNNQWERIKSYVLRGEQYITEQLNIDGEWIRLINEKESTLSAVFHYTTNRFPKRSANVIFSALADIDSAEAVNHARLYSNKNNFNLSVFAYQNAKNNNPEYSEYEFDKFSFEFKPKIEDRTAKRAIEPNKYTWSVDKASVILDTKKGRLRLPKGHEKYDTLGIKNFRAVRELESERELANIHGTFYELPLFKIDQEPLFHMMRPVSSHNKQISEMNTWNGLLVLSGVKASAPKSERVFHSQDGKASIWFGGIDDIWNFGKPTGIGGPWRNTQVKANIISDPYLMTGYDKKSVTLIADRDVEITLHVSISPYLEEKLPYKTFNVRAGEPLTYHFADGYSAHWIHAEANADCLASVIFTYE